jgi:hypothetical protein
VSEHQYRQYLPGDEIKLKLVIRYPRMYLREAGVVFRHEEGLGKSELSARDQTNLDDEGRTWVAKLTLEVPPGAVPGLYRAHRLWVKTYGERLYEYEGDEVADLANRFAFVVLDEPDEKPHISLDYR